MGLYRDIKAADRAMVKPATRKLRKRVKRLRGKLAAERKAKAEAIAEREHFRAQAVIYFVKYHALRNALDKAIKRAA